MSVEAETTSVLRSKKHWDELAKLDPCWAILSDSDKRFGKWDLNEFFCTGEQEVLQLIESAAKLGYPETRDVALDFGCGIGRLSRALSKHFGQVCGVDISEEMIRKARELNKDFANCNFVLNTSDRLGQFPEHHFDLIYTNIVLQHVPRKVAILRYVVEFVRILKPKGLLVMQIPSSIPLRGLLQLRRRLYILLRVLGAEESFLYTRFGLHPIQMNFVPQERVLSLLEKVKAITLKADADSMAGPGIKSRTYYVTKAVKQAS